MSLPAKSVPKATASQEPQRKKSRSWLAPPPPPRAPPPPWWGSQGQPGRWTQAHYCQGRRGNSDLHWDETQIFLQSTHFLFPKETETWGKYWGYDSLSPYLTFVWIERKKDFLSKSFFINCMFVWWALEWAAPEQCFSLTRKNILSLGVFIYVYLF